MAKKRLMTLSEQQLEAALIAKLQELKYAYRSDIRNRASLEANFRDKFQQLNRVQLTAPLGAPTCRK